MSARIAAALPLMMVSSIALAQNRGPDHRQVFDFQALQKQKWELVSRTDLSQISRGYQLVVIQHATPEGEGKGLEKISRVYILEGDRVEFDSFAWDKVGDTVEPSASARTFFGVRVQVQRGAGRSFFLVLSGTVPTHLPGDPIKTTNRVTVVSYNGEARTWETVADATSVKPPAVSGTTATLRW